jgi:hypothetical protein
VAQGYLLHAFQRKPATCALQDQDCKTCSYTGGISQLVVGMLHVPDWYCAVLLQATSNDSSAAVTV